jgi:hypothetical protein
VGEGRMVGTGGFEPPTPSVSGKCSPTELRAWNRSSLENRSKQQQGVTDLSKSGNRSPSRERAGASLSRRTELRARSGALCNSKYRGHDPPDSSTTSWAAQRRNQKVAADQMKTPKVRVSGLALETEIRAGRMVEASSPLVPRPYRSFDSAQLRMKTLLGPGTAVEQKLGWIGTDASCLRRQGGAGDDL